MSKNKNIKIKTEKEIRIIQEGGRRLSRVKKKLIEKVQEGVSAKQVDDLADILIKKEGGKASFKMVPKYDWATCINVNQGVVHGIPKSEIVFAKGDVVSVDVGLFYKGFHTDTSFSIEVGTSKYRGFLKVGEKALENAIKEAKPGNRIYDISRAIEDTLKRNNLQPVLKLVGHGIGRDLHEAPQIPCFISGDRKDSPEILAGSVFAIEVMYSQGSGDVKLDADGWTISSSDGKITGLFEETVVVRENGPLILTR